MGKYWKFFEFICGSYFSFLKVSVNSEAACCLMEFGFSLLLAKSINLKVLTQISFDWQQQKTNSTLNKLLKYLRSQNIENRSNTTRGPTKIHGNHLFVFWLSWKSLLSLIGIELMVSWTIQPHGLLCNQFCNVNIGPLWYSSRL